MNMPTTGNFLFHIWKWAYMVLEICSRLGWCVDYKVSKTTVFKACLGSTLLGYTLAILICHMFSICSCCIEFFGRVFQQYKFHFSGTASLQNNIYRIKIMVIWRERVKDLNILDATPTGNFFIPPHHIPTAIFCWSVCWLYKMSTSQKYEIVLW